MPPHAYPTVEKRARRRRNLPGIPSRFFFAVDFDLEGQTREFLGQVEKVMYGWIAYVCTYVAGEPPGFTGLYGLMAGL